MMRGLWYNTPMEEQAYTRVRCGEKKTSKVSKLKSVCFQCTLERKRNASQGKRDRQTMNKALCIIQQIDERLYSKHNPTQLNPFRNNEAINHEIAKKCKCKATMVREIKKLLWHKKNTTAKDSGAKFTHASWGIYPQQTFGILEKSRNLRIELPTTSN